MNCRGGEVGMYHEVVIYSSVRRMALVVYGRRNERGSMKRSDLKADAVEFHVCVE